MLGAVVNESSKLLWTNCILDKLIGVVRLFWTFCGRRINRESSLKSSLRSTRCCSFDTSGRFAHPWSGEKEAIGKAEINYIISPIIEFQLLGRKDEKLSWLRARGSSVGRSFFLLPCNLRMSEEGSWMKGKCIRLHEMNVNPNHAKLLCSGLRFRSSEALLFSSRVEKSFLQ